MVTSEKELQNKLAGLVRSIGDGLEVHTEVAVHDQEYGITTKRGYTTLQGFVAIADILVQIEGQESIAFECKGESEEWDIQKLQRGIGQCLYFKLSGAVPCLVVPASLMDSRLDGICRQSKIGLLVIGEDPPEYDLRWSHNLLLSALFLDAQSEGFDCRVKPGAHWFSDS